MFLRNKSVSQTNDGQFIDEFRITRHDTGLMMGRCQTQVPPLALSLTGWSYLRGNRYTYDNVLSR